MLPCANITPTFPEDSLTGLQALADALVLGRLNVAPVLVVIALALLHLDAVNVLMGQVLARTSVVVIFGPTPEIPARFASRAEKQVTLPTSVRSRRPRTLSKTRWDGGSVRRASSSVTSGTQAPPPVPAAIGSTSALFADRKDTTRVNADASLLKVVTPLCHEAWRECLDQLSLLNQFADVPLGLQYGFKTGVSSSILTSLIPQNHSSALLAPHVVAQHINNELLLGRYSGPYSASQLLALIGAFRTAPLGVVPKPNSDKHRVIQDLSFPRNDPLVSSVNSEINSDDFPCEWGTFAQCYFSVARAPPGTQVAVFDVDSAYRNIPVHPEDQRHFCVSWNNSIYLDHCVAFGSASSAGLFGRVADCFVAIVQAYGAQQVLKWVDDLIFFRFPTSSCFPYHYSYDSSLVFSTANKLGLPWSLPKFHDFDNSFTYLGFLWNISARTVQLPQNKKLKFANRCDSWISEDKHTLRSAQTLLGSLNHCCLIHRTARTRLHGLRSFVARFPPNASPFLSLSVPVPLSNDIRWWSSELSKDFFGCKIATPPSILPLQIYVDASTSWGIGILINKKWAAFRIASNTFSPGFSIGWAEMIAVELAVSLLCSVHPRNSHFLIHSDNQGVIGAINSNFSRGASQNASLSRLSSTLLNHDSFLSTKYIRSQDNPADPISRGILPSIASRLKTKIKLDQDLVTLLTRM